MTVRNIRSHATRGLLQPPEVRARTGYYGPEHVARLRLIHELQANGYNLAAIKHLLSRGDGAAEQVLGFARSLLAPFEREAPEVVDARELAARWGAEEIDPKLVQRAEKLGLVAPLGDGRYEILSPTVIRAGEVVRELGVPASEALDIVEKVVQERRRDHQGVRPALHGPGVEAVRGLRRGPRRRCRTPSSGCVPSQLRPWSPCSTCG